LVVYCDIEAAVVFFRHGARGPLVDKYDVKNQWEGRM